MSVCMSHWSMETEESKKMQIYRASAVAIENPLLQNLRVDTHYGRHYFFLCHVLLLLGEVVLSHSDWLMDCGDCHCKWISGKKTADCRNISLTAVPENLSSELQVLDLSHNHIPYLEENAFISANLQNLHKLFIRNCSMQGIDPRSFNSLEILIELDLSNNLLSSLRENLFAQLPKVRALILNGNLLETLSNGVFQDLKYLHKIELKHNRIARIDTQVFINVPLLTQIHLDGNKLSVLRKESFETLQRLTALSLDQNPWNCTCDLQVFRDFVIKRNLYTPPTSCYYPTHLRGLLWVEDQPEAFACKPHIIYPSRGLSINTSKENVTLTCRVHASPNTLIAWDYNKQIYRAKMAHGDQQRVYIQLLRDETSKEKEFGRDVFVSRLTILGAEKSDEGTYTCHAENAGGKDAVQMSLLVQKPGQKDSLLQGDLIVVIGLMALALLSASVLLAMATCCIYRHFKVISHHRHRNLDITNTVGVMRNGTTTPVAGGTYVGPSVALDNVSSHHYSNLHYHDVRHSVKVNGGDIKIGEKYSEDVKNDNNSFDSRILCEKERNQIACKPEENSYLGINYEDSTQMQYPVLPAVYPFITTSNRRNASPHFQPTFEVAVGGEFQPDLLPAYSMNNKQGHPNVAVSPVTSKFNSSTQEYLMCKLTPKKSKSNESEMPITPLITSSSLSAANEGPLVAETPLRRQTKSLALPNRTSTPTNSGYTYRQPPPPPYTSNRSAAFMRTRTCSKDDSELCKDFGYRDEDGVLAANKSDAALETMDTGTGTGSALTRHTIVTASPSLNFLTTTKCTPRRQLL